MFRAATGGTLIRKTSLQDRTDDPLRSGKRADKHPVSHSREACSREPTTEMWECVSWRLICQRHPGHPDTRNDLLFTMSDITHSTHAPRASSQVHHATKYELNVSLGRPCQDPNPTGGARRDRTDDLLLAKQALSQLSYGPRSRSLPAFNLRPARDTKSSHGAAKIGGPGKI